MDLNSLFGKVIHHGFQANSTNFGDGFNGSSEGAPDGILEMLIGLLGSRNPLVQLFMVLYNVAGKRTGIDPSTILTFLGFVWAANKLWRQFSMSIYRFVSEHLMANIHISSGDEIYTHMMKWLASQPRMVNSRSLTAETLSKTAWEDEDESDVLATRISADGDGVYLNFSNQEAKAPPRFVPSLGTHGFWHEGTYFRLHRKQESFLEESTNGQTFKDKENLVISCLGRSPEPIKKLLKHAKESYYDDHFAKTIVKRPSPQNTRRYGGRHSWLQVANRPVRPMKTVVLDAKQKVQVLADINEYLHPATPRWYANRGIPLRRGYLFHGPPGTGKTSLSFALAGVFGLDIYVISLLEPTLTEEDLSALFNSLPRRCVVLLEDIDTAGLSRPLEEAAAAADTTTIPTSNNSDPKDDNEDSKDGNRKGRGDRKGAPKPAAAGIGSATVADLARELKKQGNDANDKKGISLSGLLNAIDGVASHEGRVLIMTTNKPETLDDALIRPGRVDLQVGFTNATQEQARELFERMFEADSRGKAARPVAATAANGNGPVHANGSAKGGEVVNGHADASDEDEDVQEEIDGNPILTNGHLTEAEKHQSDQTGLTSEVLGDHRLDWTVDEMKAHAARFAAKIPGGQFSPAEIQGFLLKRKKVPTKAVEDVDKWVEAMVRQKESKTKIMQVQ